MTILAHARATQGGVRPVVQRDIRVALLGLGHVGGAVAELIAGSHHPDTPALKLTSALVRDVHRPRTVDTTAFHLTTNPLDAFASRPDVVIEVLGGIEPARSIVLDALNSRIAVVTANKSLLAACGPELFAAATTAGVPLLYEASVLAGVPFLGTFGRRPLARLVTGLRGIVNGTSNFILSRMAHEGGAFAAALTVAQRAGFAEPDPSKDVEGDDAVEKLCVLLRHFGRFAVRPDQIEKIGITGVQSGDHGHARHFGGAIRPIVLADWSSGRLWAYAGPSFIDGRHALCGIDGVQNAISVTTRWNGELFFSGPGAGPLATAATILDDVIEAAEFPAPRGGDEARAVTVAAHSEGSWFVRLTAPTLGEEDAAAILAPLGIRVRRVSNIEARSGTHSQWLLTHPCGRAHLEAALDLLVARVSGRAWKIPAVE